jgi:hypothetical protein
MARKKLKTIVGRTVTQDGSYVRVDRLPIYVETTGDLRLCMEVPEFIPELIGCSLPNLGDCKLEPADGRAYRKSGPVWLFGRDPDALERAWGRVLTAYVDAITALKVEPFIFVKVSCEGGHNYSARTYSVRAVRFLRDVVAKQNYEWRDDETKPLRRAHDYHLGGMRIGGSVRDPDAVALPYSDELWQKLQMLTTAIDDGFKRLEALVLSEEFTPRLLAGGNLMQLTGPET